MSSSPTFTVARLYTGPDQESYFEDMQIPLEEETVIGTLSKNIDTRFVQFRHTTGGYDLELHNAPQRQFVVMLEGGVQITTSLGETRTFMAGTAQSVVLVEDTFGKGHYSKAINGQPRFSLFIALK